MSLEIEVQKRCICLRNGNEIWVSEETYQKISLAKEGATGSMLIFISELNRELNTADIVEICTPSQMEDKRKMDRGETKCAYGKWHTKKEICKCFQTKLEKDRATEKQRIQEIENRPRTAEEKKRTRKLMDKTRKELEEKGILNTGSIIKKMGGDDDGTKTITKPNSNIKKSKDGNCVVCGNKLDPHLASVCGGGCAIERDKNFDKYKDKLI